MKFVKFSVVIPCHNAGRWIDATLDGLAAQTLPPAEVIVVDDASSDDSAARVRARAAAFAVPLEVVSVEVHNAAAARNVGAGRARSDWLAFLDADDVWYPRRLERSAHLLQGGGDVGLLGRFDAISMADPEPRPRPDALAGFAAGPGIPAAGFMERYAARGWFAGMSGLIARRDRFAAVGGLDPDFKRRHDIEVWLRLIAGHTWCYDAVPGWVYRSDTSGSLSRAIANRSLFLLRAFAKNRQLYPGPATDRVLAFAARTACAGALTDGTPADVDAALPEAWPFLPPRDRLIFAAARRAPRAFRWLNRRRRARLVDAA